MPTKTGPHLELGIAHVLFVDVVGYSKLLIDEQRTLLEELNHIIRSTAECYGLANFCALWDKYRVLITQMFAPAFSRLPANCVLFEIGVYGAAYRRIEGAETFK